MKKLIFLVILLAGAGGAGYWYWQSGTTPQTTFRLDEIKRGHLVATINSTGTLQPRELVDVGAQVAGPIIFIGKDTNTQSGIVDWGSIVEGPVYDDKGKVVPQGKMSKRLNANMIQNVVTYTVVVSVDNSDGTLVPYLTTNLSFITTDKQNALLVPNAALRWQPAARQIAPDQREAFAKLKGKKRSATDVEGQDHGFIWTKGDDGFVRYTEILTGTSDTVHTEVLGVVGGGEVPEHTQVIVGEGKAGGASDNTNPFSVQMFKPKPKE